MKEIFRDSFYPLLEYNIGGRNWQVVIVQKWLAEILILIDKYL